MKPDTIGDYGWAGVGPEQNVPGLHNFRPPEELMQSVPGLHNYRPPEEFVPGFHLNADGSTRDASAPPPVLGPSAAGGPFGVLNRLGAKAFFPFGDGSPPPYLAYGPAFLNAFGRGADSSDELSQTGTSSGYMANPLLKLALSDSEPNLGEGSPETVVGPSEARASDGRLESGESTDPNIVLARAGDDEQLAQATPPGSSAGARGGSGTNPAPNPPPGRNYEVLPQAAIERGMTPVQKKINRDQAFRELTRQPLSEAEARRALPDDWETTKPADIVSDIKRAAERHGVPIQLLARLLYQEGKFNEVDKLGKALPMKSENNKDKPIGYAQMTENTLENMRSRAAGRGDFKRRDELKNYSLANREQSFDAAAEQLAYLHLLMGGSWPKAVAGYNVGAGLAKWFNGAEIDPRFFANKKDREKKPVATDKWTKEVAEYLRFVLRGAPEDPYSADMYEPQPPNQYRVRDPIPRR